QIKKMGPLKNLMGLMPGMPKEIRDVEIDDRHLARVEGIIRSMTPAERVSPEIIDASRRQRIAKGSGTQPGDVKALIDQFTQMRRMMKQLGGAGTKKVKSRNRGGRKGAKGRRKGGRTTPKGPARVPRTPLSLPGLENGDFPGLT
ncbi:MAG: signal recognition particle protein, partial [Actinomyces sp.]